MYAGEYEGEQVTVRTNEDGLRSRYSRRKFLAHQERIAILGDSFTFGFGVRQEKTFQRVVENRLRRNNSRQMHPHIDFWGTICYNIPASLRLREEILYEYQLE